MKTLRSPRLTTFAFQHKAQCLEHTKLQLSIIQSQAVMLIRYVNYSHYASAAL